MASTWNSPAGFTATVWAGAVELCQAKILIGCWARAALWLGTVARPGPGTLFFEAPGRIFLGASAEQVRKMV